MFIEIDTDESCMIHEYFPSLKVPFMREYCEPWCFEEVKSIHNESASGYMRTIFQDPFAEESLSVNSFRIDADKIFYWGEIESYSEVVSGEDGPLEIEGTKYIYAVVDNDDFLLVLFRTEDHCTYIDSNPKDSWDIIDIDAHNLIGNVIDDIEDDECSPEKRNYVFLIDNSGNPVINMKKLKEIGFVPKEQRKKLLWPEKQTDIQEQDNRKKKNEDRQLSETDIVNESNEPEVSEDYGNWIQKLIEIESVIERKGHEVVRPLTREEQEKACDLVSKATKGNFSYCMDKYGYRGRIIQNRLVPWEEVYNMLIQLPFLQCELIFLPFNPDFFENMEIGQDRMNFFKKIGYIPVQAHVRKEDRYIAVNTYISSKEDSYDEDGYGGGITDEYAAGIIDDKGRWALPFEYCIDSYLTYYHSLGSDSFVLEEKRKSIGI